MPQKSHDPHPFNPASVHLSTPHGLSHKGVVQSRTGGGLPWGSRGSVLVGNGGRVGTLRPSANLVSSHPKVKYCVSKSQTMP
eukprot:516123-Hanusia_phi.AAC.4